MGAPPVPGPAKARLCILCRYLQKQGQVGVVEGFVQSQQCPVHATLGEIRSELLQAEPRHPAHNPFVGPHHHVWG